MTTAEAKRNLGVSMYQATICGVAKLANMIPIFAIYFTSRRMKIKKKTTFYVP
jgi:hypothetical protein